MESYTSVFFHNFRQEAKTKVDNFADTLEQTTSEIDQEL